MRGRLLAVVLAALAAAPCALAQTYYVDPAGGNDGNPGTTTQPFKTLTHAVSVAAPDAVILLRDGIYTAANESWPLSLPETFLLPAEVLSPG